MIASKVGTQENLIVIKIVKTEYGEQKATVEACAYNSLDDLKKLERFEEPKEEPKADDKPEAPKEEKPAAESKPEAPKEAEEKQAPAEDKKEEPKPEEKPAEPKGE